MGEPGGEKIRRRRSHRIRMARGTHSERVSVQMRIVMWFTLAAELLITIHNGFSHHFPRDKIGKEVVSRFRVPFYPNNKTFYTDSNGREMLKRVLNYRPSFDLKENVENVSGNYYPITSRLTLTDNVTRFSVLNDRSQGGSSLRDGEIELMVCFGVSFY